MLLIHVGVHDLRLHSHKPQNPLPYKSFLLPLPQNRIITVALKIPVQTMMILVGKIMSNSVMVGMMKFIHLV